MAAPASFCSVCGRPLPAGATADPGACCPPPSLDPPRYCPTCGRTLDVQVYPTGFVATCRTCDGVHPARRGG
jgi:predicted nucleic acid-binding Zn ribbon protein